MGAESQYLLAESIGQRAPIPSDIRAIAVSMVRTAIGTERRTVTGVDLNGRELVRHDRRPASELLRAVRTTCALLLAGGISDPRTVATRRRGLARGTVKSRALESGDIRSTVPAPDHRSIVRVGHSRKRGRTVKVLRHGDAPVIGSPTRDCHGRRILAACGPTEHHISPATALAIQLKQNLADGSLHQYRDGLSGIGLARTASSLGPLLVEPLLGGETIAYQQQFAGDRASVCSAVPSGFFQGNELVRLMADDIPPAPALARWTLESGITLPIDPTETVGTKLDADRNVKSIVRSRLTQRREGDPTNETVGDVVRLVNRAASNEQRYVGFTLVDRPTTDKTVRATRKTARTIKPIDEHGPIVQPGNDETAWERLADRLNRGERLVLPDVTITRGTSARGKYRATDKRGNTVHYWQSSTSTGLARKLALATV